MGVDLEYEITEDEALAVRLYLFDRSSLMQGSWTWLRYLYLVVGALLLALAVGGLLRGASALSAALALLPAAALIVYAFLWPTLRRRRLRDQFMQAYRQGRDTLVGRHRLSVTRDLVTDVTDAGKVTTRWGAVAEVGSTGQWVFIQEPSAALYVIPKRAFPGEREFTEFVQEVERYHATSREPR